MTRMVGAVSTSAPCLRSVSANSSRLRSAVMATTQPIRGSTVSGSVVVRSMRRTIAGHDYGGVADRLRRGKTVRHLGGLLPLQLDHDLRIAGQRRQVIGLVEHQ